MGTCMMRQSWIPCCRSPMRTVCIYCPTNASANTIAPDWTSTSERTWCTLHTKPDPRLYECGSAPTSPTQPSPDRTRFSAAREATDGPAYPLYSMRRLERSLGYQGRLVQRTENGICKTGAFSFELSDWIGLGWTAVTTLTPANPRFRRPRPT
jgi:hypothetical protein